MLSKLLCDSFRECGLIIKSGHNNWNSKEGLTLRWTLVFYNSRYISFISNNRIDPVPVQCPNRTVTSPQQNISCSSFLQTSGDGPVDDTEWTRLKATTKDSSFSLFSLLHHTKLRKARLYVDWGWIYRRVVAGPLEENYPVIACGAHLDRRTGLLQHHIARSLALPFPVAHGA